MATTLKNAAIGGLVPEFMLNGPCQLVLVIVECIPELSEALLVQTIFRGAALLQRIANNAGIRLIITNTSQAAVMALASSVGTLQNFGRTAFEATQMTWMHLILAYARVRILMSATPKGWRVARVLRVQRRKHEPKMFSMRAMQEVAQSTRPCALDAFGTERSGKGIDMGRRMATGHGSAARHTKTVAKK